MESSFDVETLKLIRSRLDYIYAVARMNNLDNPELMDIIEGLAKIGTMFATIKIEEINNKEETKSAQGYILSKLSNTYSQMQQYEKRKEDDYWKF